MPIRLVLADDHPLVLDGLENLFARREGEFSVVARCCTGRETLEAVREHRPDILVLDIRMPNGNGLDVLRQLRTEGSQTRVVLLTAAVEEEEVLEAIRLGVRGVVLKEMAPGLLVQCLHKVHEGRQWIETDTAVRALDRLLKREAGAQEVAALLTPRELQIVRLIAQGLRNKEVADRLFVTEGTVKVHLHKIYEKLGIEGRMELLLWAQEKRLGPA